jgi:hypothetical protein
MTKVEFEQNERALKALTKKVTKNKKAAQAFLVELGIRTKGGKLTKPYKDLRKRSLHDTGRT